MSTCPHVNGHRSACWDTSEKCQTRKSMNFSITSSARKVHCDQSALLLDQLIRAQQYRCRDVDLQRLGGLKIDRQFELGRLFDG